MEKQHPSKVDPLYLLILMTIPMFGFVFVGLFLLQGQGLIGLLLTFITIVWPAWIALGTKYRIREDYLDASCGPLRYRVPLTSITSIEPKRTFMPGPALSRDKLIIHYQAVGGVARTLRVSPTDKYTFVFDLGLGQEDEFEGQLDEDEV
ncbi:MAG: Bacterial PH domain [Idiomarinaceae bacterium HL-53]|nr:MAG: Bacterial PH domain [Idiomarinaceae bacterium HL-53]CUS48358.1 PH domain-containing protein [Idiomarinaceae bacterium HL-53]